MLQEERARPKCENAALFLMMHCVNCLLPPPFVVIETQLPHSCNTQAPEVVLDDAKEVAPAHHGPGAGGTAKDVAAAAARAAASPPAPSARGAAALKQQQAAFAAVTAGETLSGSVGGTNGSTVLSAASSGFADSSGACADSAGSLPPCGGGGHGGAAIASALPHAAACGFEELGDQEDLWPHGRGASPAAAAEAPPADAPPGASGDGGWGDEQREAWRRVHAYQQQHHEQQQQQQQQQGEADDQHDHHYQHQHYADHDGGAAPGPQPPRIVLASPSGVLAIDPAAGTASNGGSNFRSRLHSYAPPPPAPRPDPVAMSAPVFAPPLSPASGHSAQRRSGGGGFDSGGSGGGVGSPLAGTGTLELAVPRPPRRDRWAGMTAAAGAGGAPGASAGSGAPGGAPPPPAARRSSLDHLQSRLATGNEALRVVATRAAGLKHIGFGPFKEENQDEFFIQVKGVGTKGCLAKSAACQGRGQGKQGRGLFLWGWEGSS